MYFFKNLSTSELPHTSKSTHYTHTSSCQIKYAHKALCMLLFISDPYPNILDNQATAKSPGWLNTPLDYVENLPWPSTMAPVPPCRAKRKVSENLWACVTDSSWAKINMREPVYFQWFTWYNPYSMGYQATAQPDWRHQCVVTYVRACIHIFWVANSHAVTVRLTQLTIFTHAHTTYPFSHAVKNSFTYM